MTGVRVEINEQQVEHVNKVLYTMPDKARTVFRNAINRGLVAARVQAAKEVKKRYEISTGNLRTYETITLDKAAQYGSDVVGNIVFSGAKIPLYRFKVSPKTRTYTNRFANGRGGARVTASVSAGDVREKGMVRRKPAFIATFASGHTGIFYRTGNQTKSGKPKLHEYWSFSIADMLNYEDAREAVLERAGEITSKRIDQELLRIMNGY